MRNFLALFLMLAGAAGAATTDAGDVDFANSGSPAAQESFLRGLALLHDFEYPAAALSFQKAETIDPDFAMAYWGEAMTHTHPVWFQQDLPAARAVLQKLAPTAVERVAKARTERERDYLRAVETLYGPGTKEERDFLYADAMAALHGRYPEDVDAAAFYAVSLLGTAHHGRDYAIYMRAAAVLEPLFPTHPRHPGVLHYLIHCYDDPIHAPLGIRAARLYGSVAPSAAHALHMTSHIFLALGMWDEVLDANRRAIASVNAALAAKSRPPANCGHYPIWLHYALVQKRDYSGARKVLEACQGSAFDEAMEPMPGMDMRAGRVNSFTEMRAHEIAGGAPAVALFQGTIPEGADYDDARFTFAYADVLSAATKDDPTALSSAVATLHARQKAALALIESKKASDPSDRIRAEVLVQQGDALVLAAAGKRAEAIKALERTSALEHTMPVDFGPPAVAKPSEELLGEQLLLANRPVEAEKAFRDVLARAPGRTMASDGLARALKGEK